MAQFWIGTSWKMNKTLAEAKVFAKALVEADADRAVITVEDEGSELTVPEIEEVLAPFQRGANSRAIDGFGLGLTIVATVAEQHGGTLRFERGRQGLRARLEILRN